MTPFSANPIRAFGVIASRAIPDDLIALTARLGVAAIFFQSARTKVDGLLHVSDGTYSLFLDGARYELVYLASEGRYHTRIETYLKIGKKW